MCSLQIAETNNPNRTCKLYLRYGEYHVICDATKIFILKNHRFQASSASVDLFRHSAKIITTTVYMSDVWRPNGRTDGRAATSCNFDCLFLPLLFSRIFYFPLPWNDDLRRHRFTSWFPDAARRDQTRCGGFVCASENWRPWTAIKIRCPHSNKLYCFLQIFWDEEGWNQ